MFVDATKYMKVQDDELDKSFGVEHDSDSKFAKTSFESFVIEPSHLPYGTPWYKQKKVYVPIIGAISLVLAIGGIFGVLILSDSIVLDAPISTNSTLID